MDSWFIVRGPDWKREIEIKNCSGQNFYDYVEAATLVIESIYNNKENRILGSSAITQVSLSGFDIDSRCVSATEEELSELEENVKLGKIKFISTPIILANAGLYNEAETLKYLIDL